MKARLEEIAGLDPGRVFDIQDGQVVVAGRNRDCQLQIRDLKASRSHFRIEGNEGAYRLSDLGSTCGTFVNGHRIQSDHKLSEGDVIRAGDTKLRFTLPGVDATTMRPRKSPGIQSDRDLNELVGKKLAGFSIHEVLAEGKLGVVFKAHDPKKDRPVAIKVLRPEFSQDDDEMKRFVRTMKTVLRLRHPNIVAVYSAGRTRGLCYVVMEYVDGESLSGVIQRIGTLGMLDWTYAFRVAVHIGEALAAASRQQVVHRNIVPQNILVRHEDQLAKLGDLMLAKAIEGTFAEQVTRTGLLLGEIAYMAPERTYSDREINTRSDIYGLGATVYALLTGRPPLEDKSVPGLIARIRTEAPIKPKNYQLAIPDLFEGMVMRMLAKRPEDRFQTPGQLLKDLRRIGRYQGLEGFD